VGENREGGQPLTGSLAKAFFTLGRKEGKKEGRKEGRKKTNSSLWKETERCGVGGNTVTARWRAWRPLVKVDCTSGNKGE